MPELEQILRFQNFGLQFYNCTVRTTGNKTGRHSGTILEINYITT